jgi:hypothetical protein
MRSTDYLASIKSRNGHSMDQIALGGPERGRR